MDFSTIAHKKVAGVPVLYLAGGAAVVGLVFALKMKASNDTSDTDADVTGEPGSASEGTEAEDAYDAYKSNGTVVVAPQAVDTEDDSVYTNTNWVRDGAGWLVAEKKISGSVASDALQKYLDDANLSYEQGQWVDAWIEKKGPPPDPPSRTGTISRSAPAQTQFTNFPGKHTVKGEYDNTLPELAQLYYGKNSAAYTTLIAGANVGLPPAGTYAVGRVISIPAYREPQYYTATKNGQTFTEIAAKNATSYAVLQILNPGMASPVKKGTKVRIR